MRIYGDSLSIANGCSEEKDSELGRLIEHRIQEISSYITADYSELIKIIVVEDSDVLSAISSELGFCLECRNCDVAEEHREWYELTFVINDSGFGVVIYVSKHVSTSSDLVRYCISQMEML